MPTLTIINTNLLASVNEDALVGPSPSNRVGFNYANFLTAGNESSDTDGFMVTGISQGRLYINTGTTAVPVYKELVQGTGGITPTQIEVDFAGRAALPGGAVPVAANGLGITIRLTGVFYNNTKVSGSDSKLYWEAALPANAVGVQNAFTIRAADNTNSTWNDGGDLISTTNVQVAINVNSVNDAPVFTVGSDITVLEDSGANGPTLVATLIGPGGGVDELGQIVTMSLENNSNAGLFQAIAINAAGNLTFTPTANASGSATITVKAMDNGGTANSGVDSVSKTFVINVTAVNDAPVNATPGAVAAAAGTAAFTGGNILSVTDIDLGAGNLTVTLSLDVGTLTATGSGAAIVTGTTTNTVVITGNAADVNASLQSLVFHGNSDAVLTMFSNDNGNTGVPGFSTDTDLVTIGVAPTVVTVDEPAAGYYSVANGMDPTYVVHFDGNVVVTGTPRIAITVGAATLYATYAGGSGTSSLTFTYDVQIADNDADGIVAAGVIDLNGGTIKSPGGSNAALALNGLDATPLVLVDNTAPVPTITLAANITADDIINLAESGGTVAVTGTVAGEVANGDVVTLTVNGATFTGPVAAGAFSINVSGAALAADVDRVIDASVSHTDAALNVGVGMDTEGYTVDVTPPAPTVTLAANITADDIINIAEAGGTVAITGTVGGDAVNGDTVFLSINGVNNYSGVVAGMAFSINVSGAALVADPDLTILASISQTDAAGNTGTGTDTETYTVDVTAPVPTITLAANITADDIINLAESGGNVPITGTVGGDAVNGDTVFLSVNGVNNYSGVVALMAFSINVTGADLVADPDKVIGASITVVDGVGNPGTGTDTESYTVDIVPPVPTITLAANITADDVINLAESGGNVAITGTVGGEVAAGDTVTLTVNGNSGYTGAVTAGLTFSINVSGADLIADANLTIDASVSHTDTAGNTGTGVDTESYTVDITPPAAPTAPNLDAADDTGVSSSDDITKNTTGLTFSGTAEAGSTVSLFRDADNSGSYNVGDTILGTGVAAAGNWSFDSSTLLNGTYVIRAFATDAAGNAGPASIGANVLTVQVDTIAPAAPTLDLNAADDTGVSSTDNITMTNANLTLDITGDANAVVSIYQGGVFVNTTTLNAGGIGFFDIVGVLADGPYAFTASQVDVAGNASALSSALNVTVDTIGPAVTYNVASYNAGTHTLTIQGTGFNGLGAANVTALVTANAGDLTWDVDGGGADYILAGADVASAMVVDNYTLVITLNTTPNITNLEGDGAFGSASATMLNPLDTIAIAATFVGTDIAGNAGTGSTLGIGVLGAQNEGAMPHTYTANLSVNETVVDETMGADVGAADLSTTTATAGGLTISGNSAAQISVENFGGGTYILTQLNWANVGTGNLLQLIGADLATEVRFADGSVMKDNTGGVSDTLNGTANADQLIASNDGDRLLGNAGNDLLIGGNGSDAIYGGSGNDIIVGAGGNDYLSGGSGADKFLYSLAQTGEGYDVISGFTAGIGGDVINVTGGGTAAAVHAMAFASGADTLIVLNATETIRLLGVSVGSLTDANFGVSAAFIKGVAFV